MLGAERLLPFFPCYYLFLSSNEFLPINKKSWSNYFCFVGKQRWIAYFCLSFVSQTILKIFLTLQRSSLRCCFYFLFHLYFFLSFLFDDSCVKRYALLKLKHHNNEVFYLDQSVCKKKCLLRIWPIYTFPKIFFAQVLFKTNSADNTFQT